MCPDTKASIEKFLYFIVGKNAIIDSKVINRTKKKSVVIITISRHTYSNRYICFWI
ncbi:MAG: hypothetical protein ETSY1_43190 [Candidatus Entotheonella factor]|uniref:Uncharacterized protein n=1 Tax=Entotheonella factor TaxID=1429438 RepID=W4L3C1_ENTF1|nr:MAG: hypothetical protein ETSY1_43190 [Candidatus Entotheonella factor]